MYLFVIKLFQKDHNSKGTKKVFHQLDSCVDKYPPPDYRPSCPSSLGVTSFSTQIETGVVRRGPGQDLTFDPLLPHDLTTSSEYPPADHKWCTHVTTCWSNRETYTLC